MENINNLVSLVDADVSDMSPQEQKRLMNKLKDAICDTKVLLQTSWETRERIDKDIQRCISGKGTLTLLVKQSAEHAKALRELDLERKRGFVLSQQLEEQKASLFSSEVSRENHMKEMKQKEASLVDEEKRLTSLCSTMRNSLAQAKSHCLAADEECQRLRAQVARAASSKSQQRKEQQLVDECVAKLAARATLCKAGAMGAKRQGSKKELKLSGRKDMNEDTECGPQSGTKRKTKTKTKRSIKVTK